MSTASPRSEPFPRRDGFDPASVPVEFGGGVVLYLPPPRLQIRFRWEGGRPASSPGRSFGPAYDSLVESAFDSIQSGTIQQIADAVAALAVDLVLRNYEASPERVMPVLWFDARELEGGNHPEYWDEVLRIASILPPKSNGVGTSPPASSPESTPTD